MKEYDFGGKRKHIADFKIYDKQSNDTDKEIVDIHIGVKQ